MNRPSRRGGLILRAEGQLLFLPASVVVRIEPSARLTSVPGAPAALRGVALLGGAVVPVVGMGSDEAELVVCAHAGELIGVVGGRVVATGTFEVMHEHPGFVAYEGQPVALLDLHALHAAARQDERPSGLNLT